jgi:hypothetical protein
LEAISGVASAFGLILRDEDLTIMRDAMPGLIAIRKLLDDNRDLPIA